MLFRSKSVPHLSYNNQDLYLGNNLGLVEFYNPINITGKVYVGHNTVAFFRNGLKATGIVTQGSGRLYAGY